MRLAHAGRTHEEEPGLVTAWIVTNEGLCKELGALQRFSLRGSVSLFIGKIGNITLKVAMLVTFWNVGPLHHPRRALLHPAVARHRHAATRAIWPRHQLPSRSSTKCATLERHSVSSSGG